MNREKIIGFSGGVPVTETDIEEFVKEAERGYTDDQLGAKRGRPAMGSAPARVVQVRMEPELHTLLTERVVADDSSTSEVMRAALREYLGITDSQEQP